MPAISALRTAFPDAEFHLIGHPSIACLSHCPNIHDINNAEFASLYATTPIPAPTREIFSELDLLLAYAVDPDGQLSGHLEQIVPGDTLVHNPVPPPSMHIVDHLLEPLSRLGIPVKQNSPHIEIDALGRAYAEQVLQAHCYTHPPVIIHTGSGGIRKCWPVDRFNTLADRLHRAGIRGLFIQGPVELERGAGSHATLSPPDLPSLAGLLAKSRLFIGNDSGPGHIAAAVGAPSLTLFGPTDANVWRPRGPMARHLCAPDGDLNRLSVDRVVETVLDQLQPQSSGLGDSPA
jgi:ADP-heptose:LPS heptosyltransferase